MPKYTRHQLSDKLFQAMARYEAPCVDIQWLCSMAHILQRGHEVPSRGTPTVRRHSNVLEYSTSPNKFPLLTCKKINWEAVRSELAWFLDGRSNVADLNKRGVHIWDAWASESGWVHGVYGLQWREWATASFAIDHEVVDQVTQLVDGIKKDPYSRRHVLTAWNVGDIAQGSVALPACHAFAQWHVTPDGVLDCSLYQRSADMFLGVPFNIASYSLLNNLIADECGLKPGVIHHFMGDAHIYVDHFDAIGEMCDNIMDFGQPLRVPQLSLSTLWNYECTDALTKNVDSWNVHNYTPLPGVKAPITV